MRATTAVIKGPCVVKTWPDFLVYQEILLQSVLQPSDFTKMVWAFHFSKVRQTFFSMIPIGNPVNTCQVSWEI